MMNATTSLTQWDPFVPYTAHDVGQFISEGVKDVVVQRVRLERDRQSLFTADVFFYHRRLCRRMVWQFITVTLRNGTIHLDFPAPFRELPAAWYELVFHALGKVLQAMQANPQTSQGVIFNANFPVPDDVPALDSGGENRVAPGFAWNELYIHSAKRYLFASARVKQMRVLDLGCGVGYGAKILAKQASQVVAADVDRYPLHYGELTYSDEKIQRVHISPITPTQGLPFEDEAFDAVVSMEVIEHVPVEQMEAFFTEIARVMKPDGLLILSTPNKHVYIHYPDPYHVSLMTLEDFRRLLESRFDNVQMFGQLRARGLSHVSLEFDIVPQADDGQEIYVAVCSGYTGDERAIALPEPTVWETAPTSEERLPISVIVHTRNEENNIADCLESVAKWAGEILVMDMESTDRTVEIARRYTDRIYHHPLIHDFDISRNVSAQYARYEWILYVDADERVPPGLVTSLKQLLPTLGDSVAAVQLVYKNYFLGKWIRYAGHWYPGYKAPMLLRKGRFQWLASVHEGVRVWGETVRLSADDDACAVEHYTTPDLDVFIRKMAHYSLSTAQQMLAEKAPCSWETLAAAMGYAFRFYYDETQGYRDGAHGFLLSVCAALSALMDQLRYAELRLREGWDGGGLLPESAEQFFRFAADVAAGKIEVEQRKLSHILSVPAQVKMEEHAPVWWTRLWQRLQRQAGGRVVVVGLDGKNHLGEGWSCSEGEVEADALVAFGDGWREAVNRLREGGSFFIGGTGALENPYAWREEIERTFDATAHLIDPENNTNWLFAFGWKGKRVEPLRAKVLMVTHQRALHMLGGGETQLFETLLALREEGVLADISLSMRLPQEPYDLIHVFSLYHADKLQRLEDTDKPVVVSTIFRDNAALYPVTVAAAIFQQEDAVEVDRALQAWKRGRLHVQGVDPGTLDEPLELREVKRRVVQRAQVLLPNCQWELSALRRTFAVAQKPAIVVPNAVKTERFLRATPDAFVQRFGLRDFVLCAARIEPFKNQLMLIWALRESDIPLVLVGKIADADYGALCRRWAGKNVHFIDELPPDMLASAYAAARVHAMPSWAETPGLTTLEAALVGCRVVVGDQGAEREYFGQFAYYCNPADIDSVRQAVLEAWEEDNPAKREAFRQYILERYTWAAAAHATLEAYTHVLQAQQMQLLLPDWDDPQTWKPQVHLYLQEHQAGDGAVLQVYAGAINAYTAEAAYQLLEDFIREQGYDPGACADIEIITELPEHPAGSVLLSGGRYDTVLLSRYGAQCKRSPQKAA